MISGIQMRAARALADMSAEDLVEATGISRESLLRFERGEQRSLRPKTEEKIVHAFDVKGIEFTENQGVRLKDNRVREITGENCFALLLDEIYYNLDPGDEFLVAWADEALSPEPVHEAYRRITHKGIKYRKLIQEGNTFICGPLPQYRWVEEEYYQNAAAIFYKDKSAYLTEDGLRVVVITDGSLAKANKNFFEKIWASAMKPSKSTTDIHYE